MASDDKYDRQTRLWGAHGQRALGGARICLLTAGPTGTESLKNLVLPGCGFVTVVDGESVTEGDVGNNFFVDADSIGKPRAEVTLSHLLEMNPDVKGEARASDPAALIGSEPAFFEGFSLVIASQLTRDTLLSLSSVLWRMGVPLISVRSYGLIGHMRLAVPTHICLEAKEAEAVPDLRISRPFPALEALADSFDLATCEPEVHRHLPFPLLLIALAKKYVAEKGAAPKTFRERKTFAEWVNTQRREVLSSEGTPVWEENFDEAVAAASKAFLPHTLRPDVSELLEDPRLDALEAGDHDFWFLARALRDFRAAEGGGVSLPVVAKLPDMTATTELYLRLSNAFKEQAAEDRAAFIAHLAAARAAAGCPADAEVEAAVVDRFLASAQSLKVVHFRSLSAELGPGAASAADSAPTYTGAIKEAMDELAFTDPEGADMAPLLWTIPLRAADDFYGRHGRFPGAGESPDLDADAAEVAELAKVHAAGYGVEASVGAKHAEEITRYGACEPHAVAAVMGGVVSQEAVKLLTRQYVPVNNTYVFNGINSSAGFGEL